jgi:hypothetical protein
MQAPLPPYYYWLLSCLTEIPVIYEAHLRLFLLSNKQ